MGGWEAVVQPVSDHQAWWWRRWWCDEADRLLWVGLGSSHWRSVIASRVTSKRLLWFNGTNERLYYYLWSCRCEGVLLLSMQNAVRTTAREDSELSLTYLWSGRSSLKQSPVTQAIYTHWHSQPSIAIKWLHKSPLCSNKFRFHGVETGIYVLLLQSIQSSVVRGGIAYRKVVVVVSGSAKAYN